MESKAAPPVSPTPFLIARSTLSFGMPSARALSMARRRRGFIPGSPPPLRAAATIGRTCLEKIFPFATSVAPFCRLIFDQWLWPAMKSSGDAAPAGSALRELEAPAGSALAVLLALLHAAVAREEAGVAQDRLERLVGVA